MVDKIKVGDVVRIKRWDDMVNQFGLNDLGNIPCRGTFVPPMQIYCGKKAVVDSARKYIRHGYHESEEDSNCLVLDLSFYDGTRLHRVYAWTFTTDMVELVKTE